MLAGVAFWLGLALLAGATIYALLITTDPLGETSHDPFHDDVFGDVPAVPSDFKPISHGTAIITGGQRCGE
jgi:hypothetical protein